MDRINQMKRLADDLDRQERMTFEDAYPSIFDQTFNQFLPRSARLLRDVMGEAEFDLLAPTLADHPSDDPSQGTTILCALVLAPHRIEHSSTETAKPQPLAPAPAEEHKEKKRLACGCVGTCSGTCAKCRKEGKKLACGCTGVCSCPSGQR
ncbi:hypothetical protein BG006_004548 [Podila minutissima]|uniref:Uncharacterized protein n=1 Tax=Podila minutissima TaxID=64525 RepID=A0A9P5SL32_9FUNG|nr:hypothetical protein BG006_004548 [Podila minutissima]